jgi:hypothetical protein
MGIAMNMDEKRKYLAEHLRYEVMMLRYAHDRVLALPVGGDRNAFIESFAVHARALHELLTNAEDSRNRVAADIVPGFRVQCRKSQLVQIRHLITKLNQQILHMGTQRTDVPERKFSVQNGRKVLDWIEEMLVQFDQAVQPLYKVDWLPPRPPAIPIRRDNPAQPSAHIIESKTTAIPGTTVVGTTLSFGTPALTEDKG